MRSHENHSNRCTRPVPAPPGRRGRGVRCSLPAAPQARGVGSSPATALPSPGWLFKMKCLTGSGDVWSRDANAARIDTESGKRYLHLGKILFASAEKIKVKLAAAALAGRLRFCRGGWGGNGHRTRVWPLAVRQPGVPGEGAAGHRAGASDLTLAGCWECAGRGHPGSRWYRRVQAVQPPQQCRLRGGQMGTGWERALCGWGGTSRSVEGASAPSTKPPAAPEVPPQSEACSPGDPRGASRGRCCLQSPEPMLIQLCHVCVSVAGTAGTGRARR